MTVDGFERLISVPQNPQRAFGNLVARAYCVSRIGEGGGSPGAGHSVRAQVAAFKNLRPLYESLAGALRQLPVLRPGTA